MIPFDPAPTETEQGLDYDVGGVALTFERRPGAWSYSRRDGLRGARIAAPEGARPRFEVGLAPGESIVRFAAPVVLGAESSTDVWVAWPLEIAVRAGDPAVEVDRFRPGGRQSLLGSVSEGRVLAAVSVDEISGPDDDAIEGLPVAALRLRIQNLAPHRITLVRTPVVGEFLTLSRRDARFAATDVRVTVSPDGDAESLTNPGDPPSGFERVSVTQERHGAAPRLAWLLEATRRSVEFPL